jgi:hypothetical protein
VIVGNGVDEVTGAIRTYRRGGYGKHIRALVGISVIGIVAHRYLAASPSKLTKVDTRPGVELDQPRRGTVVQRLETNATLEAFEETDLFAKVSGYLSDADINSNIAKARNPHPRKTIWRNAGCVAKAGANADCT